MITPSFGLTATERVLPKLALDFTTALLDSRITFTRTTGASNPATYVDSDGYVANATNNQPRFGYDPVTRACKGLLIEESRTNLIRASDEFDNATYWTTTEVSVTASATTSPNNTSSAAKLIASTVPGGHRLIQVLDTGSATSHTFTVYVKAAEYSWFFLGYDETTAGTSNRQYFDASSIALGGITGTVVSPSIVDVGNGWVRASVTFNVTQITTSYFAIGMAEANNDASFAGNNSDGIYIWGAQVEAGAFATSYIPTTTTALTRNADVATITGTNFSDFWQAGKGGVLVRALPSTVSGTRPLVQFDDNTADNIIALRGNTTNPEMYVRAGNVDQATIDAGTIAANTAYRLTGTWATNDCAANLNGAAAVLDTSATIPAVTQMRLGSDGTNYLNGHLQAVEYYGDRVLNAELQILSSGAGRRSMISPVISDLIVA